SANRSWFSQVMACGTNRVGVGCSAASAFAPAMMACGSNPLATRRAKRSRAGFFGFEPSRRGNTIQKSSKKSVAHREGDLSPELEGVVFSLGGVGDVSFLGEGLSPLVTSVTRDITLF